MEANNNNDSAQVIRFDPLLVQETDLLDSVRHSGLMIILYLRLVHRAGRQRWRVTVKSITLARELGSDDKPVDPAQISRAIKGLSEVGLVWTLDNKSPRTYALPLRIPLADPDDVRVFADLVLPYKSTFREGIPHNELTLESTLPADELTPESSRLLMEQRKENTEHICVAEPMTKQRAMNIGKTWVEQIIASRSYWGAGYATKAVREQAVKNVIRLLLKTDDDGNPAVTPDRIQPVVDWACEFYFPANDYVYKVTNVFGMREHWRKLEVLMHDRQAEERRQEDGAEGWTNLGDEQ